MIGRPLRALFADTRGAAFVEMAMVTPVLALTIVGIVDISNAYSKKLALEQGAQRAIEKIMNTTEDGTVEATLTNEAVCQVNGTNANGTCKTSPITTSDVTVTWRLDCTIAGVTVSTSTTDSSIYDTNVAACIGKKAGYVQVAVRDKYTPLFPIHFGGYDSTDGTYHVSATAGMRTF